MSRFAWHCWPVVPVLEFVSEYDEIVTNPSGTIFGGPVRVDWEDVVHRVKREASLNPL
jgi:hypothetical protein